MCIVSLKLVFNQLFKVYDFTLDKRFNRGDRLKICALILQSI